MSKTIVKQDPPSTDRCDADHSPTDQPPVNGCALLVRQLGWVEAEAADTRSRLRPFEDDWDAPGMDAYDAL